MLSNLFSSQNQSVPIQKFLRKLGFLDRPVWRGVGSSRVGLAPVPASRCSRTQWARRPAGGKATARDCLDNPRGICSRSHASLSEEASSRQLCPLKQKGEKAPGRKGTGIASDSESRAWGRGALPLGTHSPQGTAATCVAQAREVGAPQGRRGRVSWGRVAVGTAGLACPSKQGKGTQRASLDCQATGSRQSQTDQQQRRRLHGLRDPCSHYPGSQATRTD